MIENISPNPAGIRKIDKRTVILMILFLFGLVLLILVLMMQNEKKWGREQSVSQNSAAFVPQKQTHVETIDRLPDGYSDYKPETVTIKNQTPPPKKEDPPPKVSLRYEPRITHSSPDVSEPEFPKKKHTAQSFLPSAPGEDIRPGASYQQRNPEITRQEQAYQSQILFYGSGKEKADKAQNQPHQSHHDPSIEKQAMINDLIDRIYPDTQDDSETRMNQRAKKAFFENQGHQDGAIYLNQRIQDPVSPYQIMAGTVLPAVLISGINSDLPGHIIAQIKENVYDTVHGRYLLVPQGTKLLGSYDNMVSWGQDKVMLAWSRLIMPDGATIVLDNMPGIDTMGYAGLKDRVNNHYWKITGAILMSTFLSVGTRRVAGEVDNNDPTLAQELAADISGDINRAGQKIISRQLNVPPTLEIRPGFPFNVMVNKDIILRPYDQ